MGSKKLLPENSVIKVIPRKNKPVSTEIILLLIRQNIIPMVKGIINVFDHMEFCLVINLKMGGNQAVHGLQYLLLGMLVLLQP